MLGKMFKKTKYIKVATISAPSISPVNISGLAPEDDAVTCKSCGKVMDHRELEVSKKVCFYCGHHFRISSKERITYLTDKGSFVEFGQDFIQEDPNPLSFKGYEEKKEAAALKSGINEGVVTGYASVKNNPVILGVMEPEYMMGSMGSAVGEKIALAAERATKERLPLLIFSASGGARMQEGIFSLMQMAKTSAAIKRHSDAGLLYISILTDPTTGGVTASFAMLGDIILAEPGALIGFAGPRVIEQTIRQKLPEGFQRAEFLLEHGMIDQVSDRRHLKDLLGQLLDCHKEA